ncbi:MAG: sugar kinase [Bdellovibrionaceae bacterium]|nr:sugar kinase [Pseudobdellovibrionaceae bacterium]
MSEILVVGSLAYDSIKSPEGEVEKSLGGSANFFSIAASHYAPVRVVGVVGNDYTDADENVLKERKNIDVSGIQKIKDGKTFHWKGKYEGDLSEAITLQTELNVFEHFDPKLPENFKSSSHVFLANIDPVLQMHVLNQIQKPQLTAMDTMNFWIMSKVTDVKALLKKIDILFINEGEAKLLTEKANAISASEEILKMGPKAVLIKRGEYGVFVRTQDGMAVLPAYPISIVTDPTGAGDTFAGACFGYLCKAGKFDLHTLKKACVHGTAMASMTVEKFGMARLREATSGELTQRRAKLLEISTFSAE